MTTVDVSIREVRGRGSLNLRNGLFGPATTVFDAAREAAEKGLARGTWESWRADVIMSGAVLRTILAGLDRIDDGYHDAADSRKFVAFRDGLRDDAEYEVSALEY